jgi:hypothetical protein
MYDVVTKIKFLNQSNFCWAGTKGISRTNAWYDFKKMNPLTRLFIDVFNNGILEYKSVELSAVRVDHTRIWVKNKQGGHNIKKIPNNSDWSMVLKEQKTRGC